MTDVEQADAGGEDLADGAARVADGVGRRHAPGPDERDDVAARHRRDALRSERPADGRAAGDGLEAAGVAAPAEHVAGAGGGGVAEVARGPHRPAVQPAAADDPGADAGRDLDEEQVLDLRVGDGVLPSAMMLTSLSTSTGTSPRAWPTWAGTSYPSSRA